MIVLDGQNENDMTQSMSPVYDSKCGLNRK